MTGEALGRVQALRFIKDKLPEYRLKTILKALKLSKSTYYHWLKYSPSNHFKQDKLIKKYISRIWSDNYKAYGYPRITIALKTEGFKIGRTRVYRLMKEMGLRSLMCRRFKKPGTHVDYKQRPNLIKNTSTKRIWRADITYLELKPSQWVYLSTIYNQINHKILSFNVGKNMDTDLIIKTLLKALGTNNIKPKFLHSDMGSQYTSTNYERILKNNKIEHSYSKQGHPYDNGPIESFHSLLKRVFIF